MNLRKPKAVRPKAVALLILYHILGSEILWLIINISGDTMAGIKISTQGISLPSFKSLHPFFVYIHNSKYINHLKKHSNS